MNDDSRLDCIDVNLAACENELHEIKLEKAQLLDAVKMVYKKHVLGLTDIGWNECGDILCNVLCNIMGDKEFQLWEDSVRETE